MSDPVAPAPAQAPAPAPAASSSPSSSKKFLAPTDLNHNDVLLGRGGPNQNYPGTVSFRDKIAASRKAEYNCTNNNRIIKNRIALEVVQYVGHCLDPPGRFLRALSDKEKEEAGIGSNEGKIYVRVDLEVALEKAKMTLRQKGYTTKLPNYQRTDHISTAPEDSIDLLEASRQSDDDSSGHDLEDLIYRGINGDEDLQQLLGQDLSFLASGDSVASGDISGLSRTLPLVAYRSAGTIDSEIESNYVPVGESKKKYANKTKLLTKLQIALGLARQLQEEHERLNDAGHLSDERLRQDLSSLGQKVYQLLSGRDASNAQSSVDDTVLYCDEDTRVPKRKAPPGDEAFALLLDLACPSPLCLLVTNLIDPADTCHKYESVVAVKKDLHLMMEDPDRYLYTMPESDRLQLHKENYFGRRNELEMLEKAFDRTVQSVCRRELVFVCGGSGAGKTKLVEQMSSRLASKNGRFVRGKFDKLGQLQPLSVIFSAFDRYCHDVAEEGGPMADVIREAILLGLGESVPILTSLLPSLTKLVGNQIQSPVELGGSAALYRVGALLKMFVKSISGPLHPVVLFFDDVQWADQAALNMLRTIVCIEQPSSLLVIFCYRDTEVAPVDPLHLQMEEYIRCPERCPGVSVSSIYVRPVDVEIATAMVADVLHLPPGLTRPLASVIQGKSGGSAFYILQFMQTLVDDGLLRYSWRKRVWKWDLNGIKQKQVSDDVVDILTKKMFRSPDETRFLLKVAACLGQGLDYLALKLLRLEGAIDSVIDSGFIYRCDSGYRFAHDKIQEAAYALLSKDERASLHYFLGKNLWKNSTISELDSIIFTIVEQLHRGSVLVTDRSEKLEIAKLCLAAGEKATAMLAFIPSSIYYLYGGEFLDESDWDDNYDLCHRLYTLSAEAQYVCGQHDGIPLLLESVLLQSRTLKDRLPPTYTLISTYATQLNSKALDIAFPILKVLGEDLPMNPTKAFLNAEFGKAKELVESTTVDDILETTPAGNENKNAAIKMLGILIRYCYRTHPKLCVAVVMRLIQLSIVEGLRKDSAQVLSYFAMFSIWFGEISTETYGYSKLAMAISDRLASKTNLAEVYTVLSIVNIYFEPAQAIPDVLDRGYKMGLMVGEFEWAFAAYVRIVVIHLFAGTRLEKILGICRSSQPLLLEYNSMYADTTAVTFQTVLNLMGHSVNPVEITGEVMNANALEDHLAKTKQPYLIHRLLVAVVFRKFDVAAKVIKPLTREALKPDLEACAYLYMGLVAVHMCHEGNGELAEWQLLALQSKERLDAYAKNCPWNFSHSARLLSAEMANKLDDDPDRARSDYDEAIDLAGRHKYVHDQAIACELASLFHRAQLRPTQAEEYLQRARLHYGDWGACAKVDLL